MYFPAKSNFDYYYVTARSVTENAIVWSLRIEPRLDGLKFSRLEADADGHPTDYVQLSGGASGFTGSYYTLRVCDDPRSGQVTYHLENGLWGSQSQHLAGTRVEQIVFGSNNVGGVGVVDFDNLRITRPIAPACHTCGNGFRQPGERCDGTDDNLCPGACTVDCRCPAPLCGNGVVERPEECDGESDDACPGQCWPDCTCPCNDFVASYGCSEPALTVLGDLTHATNACDFWNISGVYFGVEDVWELTITEDGNYTFDMCTNAPNGDECASDTQLVLTGACCDSDQVIAFNDDGCCDSEQYGCSSDIECVPLTVGTYYLYVEHINQTPDSPRRPGPYAVTMRCCGCGDNIAEGAECATVSTTWRAQAIVHRTVTAPCAATTWPKDWRNATARTTRRVPETAPAIATARSAATTWPRASRPATAATTRPAPDCARAIAPAWRRYAATT